MKEQEITNYRSQITKVQTPAITNYTLQITKPRRNALGIREVEPWPEVVDGKELLDELADVLTRFVVLPRHAAETLALWVVHTYAFELRDVSTYIGIESPEKRCGKTTLLALLSELVCRPVVAANISSPAFFRVIEELRPTLLIDEADTFLQGNDELRGILNSGYARSTAFVVRVANEVVNHQGHQDGAGRRTSNFQRPTSNVERVGQDPDELLTEGKGGNEEEAEILDHKLQITKPEGGSRLASFSCWCPKVMAAIGRLPDTLADRCIVIRMQRKSVGESCERLRLLDAESLRRKCARFVMDHQEEIASARPQSPEGLNDRAADIWEPLLVLADLVGRDLVNRKDRIERKEEEEVQPQITAEAGQVDTDSHRSLTEGNGGKGEGQMRTSNVQLPTSNIERKEDEGRNGKTWGMVAREAAVCLTGIAQENNPIGSLLMDILVCFSLEKAERVFSRRLVQRLNWMSGRPWNEMAGRKTKESPQGVTEVWLARVLRPYGIRPSTTRIGEAVAKGYSMEDFTPVFQRYIPPSEVDDLKARMAGKSPEQVEREKAAKEAEEREVTRSASLERMTQIAKLAQGLQRLSGG